MGLKCAVVSFRKHNLGAGISHGFDVFEQGGHRMFVPLIECNRFESIDRVVREFLTPRENVSDVIQLPGKAPYVREQPGMLLPRRGPGAPLILDVLETHLLTGSERITTADGSQGDYVDKCENHLLLANAYSGLAELEGGAGSRPQPFTYQPVRVDRTDSGLRRRERSRALPPHPNGPRMPQDDLAPPGPAGKRDRLATGRCSPCRGVLVRSW